MKPFSGSLAFAALAVICSYPKVVQMKMTRLFSLGTRANFIIIDYVPLQFLALVPFSLIGFCSSQSQTCLQAAPRYHLVFRYDRNMVQQADYS